MCMSGEQISNSANVFLVSLDEAVGLLMAHVIAFDDPHENAMMVAAGCQLRYARRKREETSPVLGRSGSGLSLDGGRIKSLGACTESSSANRRLDVAMELIDAATDVGVVRHDAVI